MKKMLGILGGIGLAVAVTAILLSREEKEEPKKEIKYKEVDFLDMAYVKKYFSEKYKEVIEKRPKSLPIILKLDAEEISLYIFTFYDEERGEIISKKTRIVSAKTTSQDFKDAFGDKDLLILN
ncbi:hypothetical protein [Capnocytophaga endodontalis]|uniref:Uncharacterized protein n=1 Tax=Capnocytophaga endodontalis TaxID=2708117 RepID=A0A1Z4BSD3_9FLAO|nr:hypothetical protein [Capnocytophaga endodontalis]ASF44119.1 hypothetical protein CBG49_14025 [Capnocytophaga endodontalis]